MSIDYDAKIVEAITQMLQVSQTKHTRRPEDHFIQPRTLYIRFSCMAFSHLPIRDVFVCGPDKREQWSTKCLVELLSTAVLTHLPSRICVFPMSLRKSLQRGGEGETVRSRDQALSVSIHQRFQGLGQDLASFEHISHNIQPSVPLTNPKGP